MLQAFLRAGSSFFDSTLSRIIVQFKSHTVTLSLTPWNLLAKGFIVSKKPHTAKSLNWGGGGLPTFKGGLLETSILHYDVYFTEAYGYNNIKHQFGFIQVQDSIWSRYT